MIKKVVLYSVAIASIVLGAVLMLNSFSGITGYSIFRGISSKPGYFIGAVLAVGGLLVLEISRISENHARTNLQ